jgi:hypothetical protein
MMKSTLTLQHLRKTFVVTVRTVNICRALDFRGKRDESLLHVRVRNANIAWRAARLDKAKCQREGSYVHFLMIERTLRFSCSLQPSSLDAAISVNTVWAVPSPPGVSHKCLNRPLVGWIFTALSHVGLAHSSAIGTVTHNGTDF